MIHHRSFSVFVALVVLVLACGCDGGDAVVCPEPSATQIEARFDDVTELSDEALVSMWPGSIEVPNPDAIALVDAPSRRGAGAVAMTIAEGAIVNDGTRAELTWDAGDREGATAHYAWSVRLAPDWPDVDRVADAMGRPNWQIIGQFHDQPDCALGETWDDYGGVGASPPLTVQYFWLTRDDPMVDAIFTDGRADAVVGLDETMLERPLFGLLVGVPNELRAVVPIEKDRWIDVRLEVTWSQSDAGRVVWTVDDTEIITHTGRNMINAASHYFKLGLYRNPAIAPTQSLFVDEIFATHDAAAMMGFATALAASPPAGATGD